MMAIRRLVLIVIGIELAVTIALAGLRLNSTQPIAPLVEQYNDALSGRELLVLPDQFLLDSTEKWRSLGESYLAFGYFAKADGCFRKAAERGPASPEIAFLHGYCLQRLGQVEEALVHLEQAASNGDGALAEEAHYHLGRNLLRLERADEAREAFERAGEEHLPSVYQRARLIVRQGHLADAAPLLEILLRQQPRELHVLLLSAEAALAEGDLAAARAARDAAETTSTAKSLNETPPGLSAIRERGLTRELYQIQQAQSGGDLQGAADRLDRFTDQGMRWQNKYLYLLQEAASLQLRAGNANAAEALLDRQFHTLQLPTAAAWELRGDVAAARKDHAVARAAWERSVTISDSSNIRQKLAELAEQENDGPRRLREFALAGQAIGIADYRNGQIAVARATLNQALSLNSDLPVGWFYLGECERQLGRPREAEAAYRRCLEIMPWHGRAVERLSHP